MHTPEQLQIFIITRYIGARVVRDASLPGLSGIPIFLSELRCDSDVHTNILDCEALDHGITRCHHDEDVVVHCEGKECI